MVYAPVRPDRSLPPLRVNLLREVIENPYTMTGAQKPIGEMGTDESGAACNQYLPRAAGP